MIPFIYLVIAICMVAVVTWFGIAFVTVARNLYSIFKLIGQLKTHEPELWESLGSPTMLPGFPPSLNPAKRLLSRMSLYRWVFRGGEGAKLPETKAMAENTKSLFRLSLTRFGVTFVVFLLTFGLVALVIGMGAA